MSLPGSCSFRYHRRYLHHRSGSRTIIFRNSFFPLLIPVKIHTSYQNCQRQTHCGRIRKNGSFLLPLLWFLAVYDLSKIPDSLVLYFFRCLPAFSLASFDHICLHLRIFLIINIMSSHLHNFSEFVCIEDFFLFPRISASESFLPQNV